MFIYILPEEIWINVFRYLSFSDKSNTRQCCRYFKQLVDHRSLWINEVVVLRRIRSYNPLFWKTLQNRMLKTAVVVNANAKEWRQLATSLPWLTSITIDLSVKQNPEVLMNLGSLSHLKRLIIRTCPSSTGITKCLTLLPQLQHLTLCHILKSQRSDILRAICQLCNLKSLHYHEGHSPIPVGSFHLTLQSLPKLKHLSLKMGAFHQPLPDNYLNPLGKTLDAADSPHVGNSLISLELLGYMDPALSPKAFNGLPSLEGLTVKYTSRVDVSHSECHLTSWLKSLSSLQKLAIVNGPPLSSYVHCIPRSLRSLSLAGMQGNPQDMVLAAKQAPGLQQLQYDPLVTDGPNSVMDVAKLFPQLQTLRFRSSAMTHKDVKKLQRLPQLKHLVILDAASPLSTQLMATLQPLTLQGIQVDTAHVTNHIYCYCQ